VNRCLHKLRAVHILLALLVLPGFVIRAAVPPGFMPVASRGTTLTMAICPGHAAQSGALEAGAPPAPGDHRQPAGQSHEARIGLDYLRGAWTAGALVRAVAEQDRYVINQGNIVGQDLGPTQGFTVFAINGGWRPRTGVLLTAGIDNLFDRAYAEHLSRGGAMVSGYEQTTKVNEPGRTLWMKFDLAF
jgi:outer membrane receptor protein involved in Fe transport